MTIKIEQGCFILWLPVIEIKHKPFKSKNLKSNLNRKVFKPNYK